MNKTEASEATDAIGMMLKAFPSSQSTISNDSARVYLFAVEEFTLEAIRRACRMFVRGEVPGRNNAFAPSAPELVDVCRTAEGALNVEQYEEERVFIECDTDLWRKMEIAKDCASLPAYTRHGKRGWFFLHEEVNQAMMVTLPPPISEEERREKLRLLADRVAEMQAARAGGNDGRSF